MRLERKIKLYTFDELSNRAKDRARDWYRGCMDGDNSDYDHVIDDFQTIAEMLGINLRTHRVGLHGGGHRNEPNIWWSVGGQGGGAAFDAHYAWSGTPTTAVKEHAPQDAELHRIADALLVLQGKHEFKLKAGVESNGRNTSIASVTAGHSGPVSCCKDDETVSQEDEDELLELMRDLARWLHKRLEDHYHWLYSDECVDESIRANEYTFDEDGERED